MSAVNCFHTGVSAGAGRAIRCQARPTGCIAHRTSEASTSGSCLSKSDVHNSACFSPASVSQRRRQLTRLVVQADPTPEQQKAMKEALDKAMQDPEAKAKMMAMQEALKNPQVAQQVNQMASMMQNPQMIVKMQELKDDPDLKPMFDDIKKNGMGAMMRYWNDKTWLAKLGEKLKDSPMSETGAGSPVGASPMAPPPEPEINTLLDAAKYGDEEAVEDFLAIGKDVNMKDPEQRSPLHYAVAYSHFGVAQALLEAGAEVDARDAKDNTPLHYAAGYGRIPFVKALLERGANGGAENDQGSTPYELVKNVKQNPINADAEVMELLEAASKQRAFQDQ